MKVVKLIIFALMVSVASLNGVAQKKISHVVKEIEKEKTTKVIYSEKRDPQNKKVYKISKHVTFYNKNLREKLLEAISAERENSVSYKVLTNCVIIKFSDGTGENTLEIGAFLSRKDNWSIMIKKTGYKACDGSFPDWDAMIERLINTHSDYETFAVNTIIFVSDCNVGTNGEG